MIEWVFLDVGNILLDEDRLTAFVFRRHFEAIWRARPDVAYADLLRERERLARDGSRWPLHELVVRHLGEEAAGRVWAEVDAEVRGRFGELSPPIAGAGELLDWLAPRLRLGLIANQGTEARDGLDALGWLRRFEVVAFGELEGAFKPDPALFRIALERAGVEPSACLMVGDRPDNDIAPAAGLGMATALVRWPARPAMGDWTADPDDIAYLRMLGREAARREAACGAIRPTLAVETIGELPRAIERLGFRSG